MSPRRGRASIVCAPHHHWTDTHYGSLNRIWQLRKRLYVGAEGLYGLKETKDRSDGDVVRFQLGLLCSIFD
jgi:hypothetical protein